MSESVTLPRALRDFVDTAEWTFAKTMPEWPHEYIVRERVDKDHFVQMVRHIRQAAFFVLPVKLAGGRRRTSPSGTHLLYCSQQRKPIPFRTTFQPYSSIVLEETMRYA